MRCVMMAARFRDNRSRRLAKLLASGRHIKPNPLEQEIALYARFECDADGVIIRLWGLGGAL